MTTEFNSSLLNANTAEPVRVVKFAFESLQGLTGYTAIASEWQELSRTLGADCAFQHRPEWYLSFLESGADDPDNVWFVTARNGSSLAAVVPLQFQNYRIGRFKPRLLGTIDDDQLQLSDFVFPKLPANADLMEQLVSWLRTQKKLKWDGLRLRKVREDSAIGFSASAGLPKASQVIRHDASCHFDTRGTFEDATRAMSGDFRRNVRRQARRAEEGHTVRVESVSTPADINVAFQHFLKIEASGWKGSVGEASAIYCQPALLNFYQALVNYFGTRGECVINLLWFNEDPVAAQFGLRIGGTLHILKFGYAEEYARFAPGNVLLLRILQLASEDPAIDTVGLVNDPPWLHRFRPLSQGVWSYFIPNTTMRGRATLFALLAKRKLDKWKQSRATPTAVEAPAAAETSAS